MKREGQVRIPSGCAISAVISREGRRMTGEKIVESMIPMHDRSNGLGGGFAAYGIYPEYRDYYAFHIFFDSRDTRKTCEALLKEGFEIVKAEHIPIRQIPEITDVPLIWRYFLAPMQSVLNRLQLDAEEYVARIVTKINAELRGAYVFSSGKNMGTFKAVGYAMRGGEIYVQGNAGYRAGIHMKAYQDQQPVIVIGGRAGSFLGEYQAGGTILVLGLHTDGKPAAGYFPCTGQHGGRVIFRGDVSAIRFPDQVTPHPPTKEETALLRPLVERWCALFGGDAAALMGGPFTVVTPDSKNPYRQMYAAN